MSRTLSSADDRNAWDSMGLDAILDPVTGQDCNVRPDGFEITAGECFATVEHYHAPDGRTYHVLFTSSWCNYWATWTTTHATLYDVSDPDDMAEWTADVAEWEAKPEEDPDADWGSDDDDEPDDDADPDDGSYPYPDAAPEVTHFDPDDQPDPDVPNLDCMTIDPAELREWAQNIPSAIPYAVRSTLAGYAITKADAMDHRAAGRITEALALEAECDRFYAKIPAPYRW